MNKEKFESNGRLQGVLKETKPIRKYSTEPVVAINHQKLSDVYTDASKQYQDGLTAADNGVPSTLNKQLTMMSIKYVKPSVYSHLGQANEYLQPGYRAALMMNLAKEREQQQLTNGQAQTLSAFEQLSSADELKKRRNQITVDYNYFLKRIGNDELKKAIVDLAVDLTFDSYDYLQATVETGLPARVDNMPNDMEAMEALITGLNNTNKSILIMDEIYINAMLAMFLNDYNKKDTRDVTFLFKPFNSIKSFTDSEALFTAPNCNKIGSLDEFNFAGVDLVYLDLSLMTDVVYEIICQIIISTLFDRGQAKTRSQIVVKTNQELGSSESEFFRLMGYNTFVDIMRGFIDNNNGVELRLMYDAVTGTKKFQSGVSTRVFMPSEITPMETVERQQSSDRANETKLEKYNSIIHDYDARIQALDRAAASSFSKGENGRDSVEEADRMSAERKAWAEERNKLLVKMGKQPEEIEAYREDLNLPDLGKQYEEDKKAEEEAARDKIRQQIEDEKRLEEQEMLTEHATREAYLKNKFYSGLDDLKQFVLDESSGVDVEI